MNKSTYPRFGKSLLPLLSFPKTFNAEDYDIRLYRKTIMVLLSFRDAASEE